MSARATLALALLAGCGFQAHPATGDAAGGPDASTIDAPIGTIDAPTGSELCVQNALVTACLTAAPTGPRTLTGPINTDDAAACASNVSPASSPGLCILAGTTITVAGVASAHGSRPLVLLASGAITIPAGAAIDVAGHLGGIPQATGPGAGACVAGTPGGKGGGGAGGSFGSMGAPGGPSAGNDPGGKAASVVTPTRLVGGCPGQDGIASGDVTGQPGKAGPAGGALALLSKTAIEIDGVVDASGGGGAAATHNNHGGGGGGAGGLIVVDAPMVTGSGGRLFATGGGGGEGAGGMDGVNGADPTDPTQPASGGAGVTTGGDGGNGAAQPAAMAGKKGDSAAGGGGGGGGNGLIKLFTAPKITGVTVAPVPGK
ncbi:MAG TPA: hypothetical protein VFP84_22415 [Kofleriaceae bacterium]|nr:hypothetical protein [Kofleriaceae bacterium]